MQDHKRCIVRSQQSRGNRYFQIKWWRIFWSVRYFINIVVKCNSPLFVSKNYTNTHTHIFIPLILNIFEHKGTYLISVQSSAISFSQRNCKESSMKLVRRLFQCILGWSVVISLMAYFPIINSTRFCCISFTLFTGYSQKIHGKVLKLRSIAHLKNMKNSKKDVTIKTVSLSLLLNSARTKV